MGFRSLACGGVAILTIAAGLFASSLSAAPYSYTMDFNLPIPSPDEPESEYGRGWMDDALIEIPHHFVIDDLDVRVDLTHEGLIDLEIVLESPAGTNVFLNLAGNLAFMVRGENGGLTAYGGSVQWLFDDEAIVPIEEATEPFVGPFKPAGNLSLFDGEDVYGQWCLQIQDTVYAHTGTLDSFGLVIATPEPATAMLLVLGAGLVTLFRPNQRS
jgi:subtilisin-like proprotein convertase family protein